MEPIDCKVVIRNLNGTDSTELNQYSYNDSVTHSDRLSFQVQIEKNQTPFTVTNLYTVHTGVFNYQPKNYDWIIIIIANSKSLCKVDNEYIFDKDSWSFLIEEFYLDYDDELDKLIPESHTIQCLHFDGFRKTTLKHP